MTDIKSANREIVTRFINFILDCQNIETHVDFDDVPLHYALKMIENDFSASVINEVVRISFANFLDRCQIEVNAIRKTRPRNYTGKMPAIVFDSDTSRYPAIHSLKRIISHLKTYPAHTMKTGPQISATILKAKIEYHPLFSAGIMNVEEVNTIRFFISDFTYLSLETPHILESMTDENVQTWAAAVEWFMDASDAVLISQKLLEQQ